MIRKRNSGKSKAVVVAAVALLALGGGWYFLTAGEKVEAHSFQLPEGGKWEPAGAAPDAAGEPKFEQATRVKLRLGDQDIEFDPTDPASMDKALEKVPADKRDEVRKVLEDFKVHDFKGPNGERRRFVSGGGAQGPVPDLDHDAVSRDAKSVMDAMRELMRQGVPEDEARRIAQEALADSVRKQLDNPNAKIETMLMPEGEGGRIAIMVGVEDDGPDGGTEQQQP